jgi:hypothetical protein
MEGQGMSDEALREAYQRALEARRGGGRERCPSPEAMLSLLRREGTEEQRLETLDHVMGCGACRPEFELLRAIEQAGAGSTTTAQARPAVLGIPRRFAVPLALAASLLIVVAVGQRLRSPEGPDVERGRMDGVTLLGPPTEIAPGMPATFAWKPVPGAESYVLEVLDEKGQVVWGARTSQTSVTMSDPLVTTPGRTYRWWVRAITASGPQRASAVRSLRIQMK